MTPCSRSSETPETDTESFPDFERGGDVVLAEFARKLERERDDAITESTNAVNDIIVIRARLEAERDAARAALMLAARWGISSDGYSATVAGDIRRWIINGMRGDAPKAPDYYPENA